MGLVPDQWCLLLVPSEPLFQNLRKFSLLWWHLICFDTFYQISVFYPRKGMGGVWKHSQALETNYLMNLNN